VYTADLQESGIDLVALEKQLENLTKIESSKTR